MVAAALVAALCTGGHRNHYEVYTAEELQFRLLVRGPVLDVHKEGCSDEQDRNGGYQRIEDGLTATAGLRNCLSGGRRDLLDVGHDGWILCILAGYGMQHGGCLCNIEDPDRRKQGDIVMGPRPWPTPLTTVHQSVGTPFTSILTHSCVETKLRSQWVSSHTATQHSH